MTCLLAWISLSIFSLFFLYFYRQKKILSKTLNQKIFDYEKTLQKSSNIEKKLNEEIDLLKTKLKHSTEDSVTKLLGWQLFQDRLEHSIQESKRYKFILGILMIDCDDFKMVNDALGHEVGNAVLYEIGIRLQDAIRQVDSVSRFNKDTFAVLLTQLAKPETAAIVAQRILQAMEEPFHIETYELYLTCCIGISIFPTDAEDTENLLRKADFALKVAKKKGKQVYQFHLEQMQVESFRELALSTGLRRESFLSELILYYEPIYNLQTKKVFCLDALLYWQHPNFGLIHPNELLSYAERQNKLNILTEWLVKNACNQFLQLRNRYTENLILSIPLSIKQLTSTQFIYQITQILKEVQFNPEWLLFEIKEHAQMSFTKVSKALNMLEYLKIKLAIADFGNSPYSLSDLKHIRVNFLKLDHSFMEDFGTNSKTRELIHSLGGLASTMQTEFIIQGVKTKEEIQFLKEQGYTFMQGAYFGQPINLNVSAPELTTVLD